mmetsp:Transcript_39204/g.111906  ORF Transcript_39204/g.111906 Transcript_39204/m.111906 type:complete len:224 (+) Transcript_39204:877-1548(+)
MLHELDPRVSRSWVICLVALAYLSAAEGVVHYIRLFRQHGVRDGALDALVPGVADVVDNGDGHLWIHRGRARCRLGMRIQATPFLATRHLVVDLLLAREPLDPTLVEAHQPLQREDADAEVAAEGGDVPGPDARPVHAQEAVARRAGPHDVPAERLGHGALAAAGAGRGRALGEEGVLDHVHEVPGIRALDHLRESVPVRVVRQVEAPVLEPVKSVTVVSVAA